jgi:proline iminopeptidase
MANNCFLEEGQLLKNAGKIAHVPAFIVNGRYDMICSPKAAYRLHEELSKSKLVITDAPVTGWGRNPSNGPCSKP